MPSPRSWRPCRNGLASTQRTWRTVARLSPCPLCSQRWAKDVVGALMWRRHFAHAAEIHLLAVDARHHRRGIGRQLIADLEARLSSDGVHLLQAKTTGPSHSSPAYAATRLFFQAVGFEPLEENEGLWPGNPCLLLVKHLNVASRA